jgi:tetratricopeptide (TPR) repeat protein
LRPPRRRIRVADPPTVAMPSPSSNADRTRGQFAADRRPAGGSDPSSFRPLPHTAAIPGSGTWRRDAISAAALAGLAFFAFSPALRCGFVNFDDPTYVTQNEHVLAGMSVDGVRWAFTTCSEANWHPLTWLSLQLDGSLWKQSEGGPDAVGFHLTNILVHSANAALLFLALRTLSGCFWRSMAVSLLFAVHPLRVESVAWVAERKDVLCAFFGLLALWAYGWYVQAPSIRRYILVLVPFGLSLMAKSMMVTLPCLFLVLDGWPLARWPGRSAWQLVREKLPLFVFSAGSSVITVYAQSGHGAVISPIVIPPLIRAENAVLSFGVYLLKTVWPANLAVFYPHRGLSDLGLETHQILLAGLALVVLTAAVVAFRNKAPYLMTGWLWYLGTLVPVIGLVQVGGQAYADRYTYFPQVGILIALCWGAADLARGWPRSALSVGAAVAVVLAVVSWRQQSFWRTSVTLWEHDVNCTAGYPPVVPPVVLNNYGVALQEQGELTQAIGLFRAALDGNANDRQACLNLGVALHKQGRLDEAAAQFKSLCKIDPNSAEPRVLLGDVLCQQQRFEEAERQYKEAIRIEPGSTAALCNLGRAELAMDRPEVAEASYRAALEVNPNLAAAHYGLGSALVRRNKLAEAIAEFREAIRFEPRFGPSHNNLGDALERNGDLQSAAEQYEEATRLSPGLAMTWYNLGRSRGRLGRVVESAECMEKAVALEPRSSEFRIALAGALDGLAAMQASGGRFEEAVATARRARDQAAAVGRSDLTQQIEARLSRYERKEVNPSPGAHP